jgi:transposase
VPATVSTIDDEEDAVTVMIGVDPHKATHTAVALDDGENELATLTVPAGRRQLGQLLAWAAPFQTRTWAVEAANGWGYLLSQQLVAGGEAVVDVPATLAAQVRVLGSGRSNKNDPNDARSVAVAALRAPALAAVRAEDHRTVLRLLARRNLDLGRWRNKVCCRLHALACELAPGGIPKKIVVTQARAFLEGVGPQSEAAAERHRLAVELVDDLVHIDTQIRQTKQRITQAAAASGTTLTELFGVGDGIAAMVIAFTGDVARFRSPDAYAAYNGTAPVEVSSGGRRVHRLSRRGNRQLNHAIHLAAVCQIRFAHKPGPRLLRTQAGRGQDQEGGPASPQTPPQRRRLPPAGRRRRASPAVTGPGGHQGRLEACVAGIPP